MQQENKPLFDGRKQNQVVTENRHLFEQLKAVENIGEWNILRKKVKDEFKGTELEQLMLLGYVDGVLFPMIFKERKKKKEEE